MVKIRKTSIESNRNISHHIAAYATEMQVISTDLNWDFSHKKVYFEHTNRPIKLQGSC